MVVAIAYRAFLLLLAGFAAASGKAQQSAAPDDAAARIAGRFVRCDVDGDGDPELGSVAWLDGHGAADGRRVVVLVEARLLADRPEVPRAQVVALRERLGRFAVDLSSGGRRADVLVVEPGGGERHRDGRIVLALRRLLRAFADDDCGLDGAILVGHFPDALLLRTCLWRRDDAVELVDRTGAKRRFDRWLRAVPENVAWKCDLVLADLDGAWESLYFEAARELPQVLAAFDGPVPEGGGPCVAVQTGSVPFRDAFHVADGRVAVDADRGVVTIDDADRDHECTPADRAHENPLAQPEIAVSRIDARGVAWSPRPQWLDATGAPRTVDLPDGTPPLAWRDLWQPDPALELRLLVDHLDRNHAFRTAPCDPDADRPASVAWGLGSGMASARRAREAWAGFDAEGYDLEERVDLARLAAWWRRPAVLRTLRAHSDPFAAAFAQTEPEALGMALGGQAWSFRANRQRIEASLADQCRSGRADFSFYRSLWHAGGQPAQPYLMLHTGCEAISPHGATSLRYDHPEYGVRQHAEAILFFTPCVALLGRAKVFYDEPRGFADVLRAGGSIGDAWRRYFAVEADSAWAVAGGDIGRKRAAFWSLLGDWTLGLPESR